MNIKSDKINILIFKQFYSNYGKQDIKMIFVTLIYKKYKLKNIILASKLFNHKGVR